MIVVRLVNRYGEQIRVQLGSSGQALVVDLAVAHGWQVRSVTPAG